MSSEEKQGDTTQNNDYYLDSTLRPTVWDEYIGQKETKRNLQIILTAAREREHPAEHMLFYGPPGLGKTTLAHLIASEMGAQIKVTSGPAFEKVGDVASILTNLQPGDVLFIDEIHRLNKSIEEVLYPAMEDGKLNIIIGKGPSARTIQLDLPPITILAATTQMAGLSSPLRSRFTGGTFRLEYYDEGEIESIVNRNAKILGIKSDPAALKLIAARSRFTPRIANQILKRCRDYAQVNRKALNLELAEEALRMMGIDGLGLSKADRNILQTIVEKFNGGPVGLGTLAAATSENAGTIEEVNEPYLLQLGLIDRTSRGRVATLKAYDTLNLKRPDGQAGLL